MSDFTCENCGTELTREEYIAVGRNTPIAQRLALDSPAEDGYHITCEGCFRKGVNHFEQSDGGDA